MPRRTERTPTFQGSVPVFLPTESGVTEKFTVGKASLRGGQLVVKFKDTLPAVAIQRMLERGSVMGLSFVMLEADPANQAAQERLLESEETTDSDVEDIIKLNDDDFTVENLVEDSPERD